MESVRNRYLFLEELKSAFEKMLDELNSKPSLHIKDLNPKNTVLIIIDMVNGFCKEGSLYSPRIKSLIENTVETMKLCRENNIPVIAFADSHTDKSPELKAYPPHCIKGSLESEIIDEIKEVGGYTLIEKNSTNGFLEDKFQQWLKENSQITNMIVIGDCTDICIEQFSNCAKAYYNIKDIESRIIVPMDTVETYDLGTHKADLLNIVASFIMAGNGVELIKTIE
ncbi:cysteine hydrolase [Clostridium sp. CX1]|uniref:isochorismatase family cysteine hydrolase n=1 Tax=Clostridium sp. CX1 TaxID=2978346 RepID=UPI0021C0646A|nr:isochorismatase family cysteine hydrolase [Clostridium sp. CX1]MCT8975665.1 cysteine hydrolase [Clostridium sp. CX1]